MKSPGTSHRSSRVRIRAMGRIQNYLWRAYSRQSLHAADASSLLVARQESEERHLSRDLPRGTQGPEYSAAHAMRCLRRDRSVRYMTSLHKLKASCLRCSTPCSVKALT